VYEKLRPFSAKLSLWDFFLDFSDLSFWKAAAQFFQLLGEGGELGRESGDNFDTKNPPIHIKRWLVDRRRKRSSAQCVMSQLDPEDREESSQFSDGWDVMVSRRSTRSYRTR
jgi:hypothetical protein